MSAFAGLLEPWSTPLDLESVPVQVRPSFYILGFIYLQVILFWLGKWGFNLKICLSLFVRENTWNISGLHGCHLQGCLEKLEEVSGGGKMIRSEGLPPLSFRKKAFLLTRKTKKQRNFQETFPSHHNYLGVLGSVWVWVK